MATTTSILKTKGVEFDPDAMAAAAAALGVKIGGKKPETVVKNARVIFQKRMKDIPKDDLIQCPKCGELTDDAEELEACPFCGDAGLDENEAEPTEGIEAQGNAEDDTPAAEEPPAADMSDDGSTEPDEPDPEPPADPDKFEMSQSLAREEDIIRAQQTNMMGSGYEMGLALKRVHEGELWKARGHKHFRAFCKSVSVGTPMAYRLMELVSQFDKQTFLDVDKTKLMIIAAAPKQDKAGLEKSAREGASKRKLEREAKAKKSARGDGGNGSLPGRPAKKDQSITLLAKVGGRPKTVSFRSKKSRQEIKVWNKDSFAEIQISDEVTQLIALKYNQAGKITGVTVAYKRVEKDGASA